MKTLLVLLMALVAAPAWAQEDALKGLPGYVDFGELGGIFGEPAVEIAVGSSLLNMVGAFSASDDPEVAALLRRLKGVRIRVFETGGFAAGALDHVKEVSSRLSASGWEPVVTVNTPEEQVRIFMKISNDLVEGITVMAVEEHEAAFINVIGDLKPAELEKVMNKFEVDIDGSGE